MVHVLENDFKHFLTVFLNIIYSIFFFIHQLKHTFILYKKN